MATEKTRWVVFSWGQIEIFISSPFLTNSLNSTLILNHFSSIINYYLKLEPVYYNKLI